MRAPYAIRPIGEWPGERTSSPRCSPFRAPLSTTLDELESEIAKIGATDVFLQMDVTPGDIRIDGRLRANARPASDAVILTFTARDGSTVSMPCDTYSNADDNLRAIALSLKALRAVDRYGVSKHGEQYRGWTALPPAGGSTFSLEPRTAAQRMERLSFGAETVAAILTDRDAMRRAYRSAAKTCHPDAGGDPDEWADLEAARLTLDTYFANGGHHA